MCIHCNKIVNTDLKEINKSYIENIICETDYIGIYRKFTISKYDNGEFTLDYESEDESFSMEIRYCGICGSLVSLV